MSTKSIAEQVAELERENARLRVENVILTEGCAIIREVACGYAPVVGHATRLQTTIFKVMADPAEMTREIDRRIADPKRTWWTEEPKKPDASGAGSQSAG